MTVSLDLDRLVAIDVHTHCEISRDGHAALPADLLTASGEHFKTTGSRAPQLAEMAAYYRERKMAAVVFTVDAEAALGHPAIGNEEVAEAAAEHPDVLIPFASIDPAKGRLGARAVGRLVGEHAVRGFKFHPILQAFFPNDRATYPLYEAIEAAGVPALFHSGQTGIGAGLPGGAGLRLKYANPLHLDDVAADFPDLQIVIAHPSFPWQDEALAVAVHKPNVWIDLSGWAPKYFPPQLVRYADTLLRSKVLFGSDYPLLTPDRWLSDFDNLPLRPESRQAIRKDNAARLLGLTSQVRPDDRPDDKPDDKEAAVP